ncbi:MAG: hypothetical protein ACRDG4_08950, partial [Chloroflexota bacterium]
MEVFARAEHGAGGAEGPVDLGQGGGHHERRTRGGYLLFRFRHSETLMATYRHEPLFYRSVVAGPHLG